MLLIDFYSVFFTGRVHTRSHQTSRYSGRQRGNSYMSLAYQNYDAKKGTLLILFFICVELKK